MKELEIFRLILNTGHKNILRFENFWFEYKSIEKNSILNLEMELCEQTLDEFITSIEAIKLEENNVSLDLKYYISSAIYIEILEGVNYLHKLNPQIIHRDLCPENILLRIENDRYVIVKIADFGLVTVHKYDEQLRESDKGSLKYFAPEVENG